MPSDTKKKKKTARADKSKPKSKDTDIKKKKKTANTTTNTNTTRNSGKTKNTKTITKTKTKTKAKTKANTKVKAKAKPKTASKTLVKAKTKAKPKTKTVSKTTATSTTSKAKPKTVKTTKNAKSTKSVKTAKTIKTAKATKPTKPTKSIKTAPAPKAKPKTVKTKTRLVKPIEQRARAKSKTTKSVRTAPKPRPKTRAAYQPAPKRVNDDDDNIFKIFDDPAPSAPPVRKTTKPRATSTTPKRAPSAAKKPTKSLEDYYDEVDFNAIINGDARYEDFVPANIARKMRAEERKEAALERERKEKIDNTIKSIKDTATTIAGAVKYTAHKAKEYKHKHDVKHNARKIKEESARAEESMANESYGYDRNQSESNASGSTENNVTRAEERKAPARSTVDNYYQDLMHGSEYKKQRADPLWVMPNYEPSLTNLDKYGSASGSGAGTPSADANAKKIQRAIRDASRRASSDIKSAQRALNNAKRYKGAVELSDEDESKIARLQKDLDAVVSAHDNTSGSVDARENAEIIKYYNTQSNNARLIKKSAKQLAKYFSHKYSRLNDEGAAGADTVGGARDDEETNKTRRKGIGIGLGFSLNPLKW